MQSEQENPSRTELRKLIPLLKVEKVRPGDVLLTRGCGIRSSAIAAVANGPFSHAAVWIALGELGGAVLAEADGFGVGFTPILPNHLQDDNEVSQALVFSLPSAPSRYMLMRHPDIESVAQERMLAATAKLQDTEFIKAYSSLPRLVDAVDMPAAISATARSILSFVEALQGSDVERGTFCSELVAIFFAEIGLPLFPENRDAAKISPNHLASSLLFEVPDAFLEFDQIPDKWKIRENLTQPIFWRSTFLPFAIRRRDQAESINRVVESIEKNLNENLFLLQQQANILDRALQRAINNAASQCEALDDWERGAHMRQLSQRLRFLSVLRTSVYDQGTLIHQEGGIEEIMNWAPASVELIRLWRMLVSRVEHAFLRSQMVFALNTIRRVHGATRSPLKRFQMRCRRKNFIRQWQKRRKDGAMIEQDLQLFLHGSGLSDLSLYYVDLTVTIAEQTALAELANGQSNQGEVPI